MTIKKVFVLMKKDLILSGVYKYVCLLIMIGIPFLRIIARKSNIDASVFLLLAINFGIFSFLSQVLLVENIGKGNSYLVATPYSKTMLVLEKYCLIVIIALIGSLIFLVVSKLNAGDLFSDMQLSLNGFVLANSIAFLVYDILLPISFRYQYEKIKIWFNVLSVCVPVWSVVILLNLSGQSFMNKKVYDLWGISGCIILIGIDAILMCGSILLSLFFYRKREF